MRLGHHAIWERAWIVERPVRFSSAIVRHANKGGTLSIAEAPQGGPTYIFPIVPAADESVGTIERLRGLHVAAALVDTTSATSRRSTTRTVSRLRRPNSATTTRWRPSRSGAAGSGRTANR